MRNRTAISLSLRCRAVVIAVKASLRNVMRQDPARCRPMINLEQTLASRFPAAFRPAVQPVTRPLIRGVEKLSRLPEINAFLAEHGHLPGMAFVDAALEYLGCRYAVDQVERERVPQSGRCIIVANHPMGALDALALLHFVGSVRRDVKILANDFLAALEPLGELLLPLRILGGRPDARSIQAVEDALNAEQAVIVFPAGEVSRLGLRGVRDGQWRRGFLRFAKRTAAPVLPVRIEGRNSALFYGASAIYKPLATALLAREMFVRRGARLNLRVGLPQRLDNTPDTDRAVMQRVRRALAAIGRRSEARAGAVTPIAHARDRAALLADLSTLELIGETADGKRILCGRLRHDSALLQEIGRLREVSFRAVGEGSGKRLDLDRFDAWYDHIVLWDQRALEIAGAYRVARCAPILAERGYEGLYSASLFHFTPALQGLLAQGMELGRSFVAPKYWGSRSLDYLWYGIGAYLAKHPELRYLFGPVSISAALPLAAREQLVAYYSRYFGDEDGFGVEARSPFRFHAAPPGFGELDAGESFRLLQDNLKALGARVPTLYRQYTELCEPGGVRFLAFGVDADFADSIDGLILLDLERMRPNKRRRYLPEANDALPGAVA